MTDSISEQATNSIVPANEPERLAALYRYQILDTPAELAFDRITSLAARLFKLPIALISLVDESRAWFKSSIGFGAPEVPRNDAICNVAVLINELLIIPDTRLDDRFACNPFVQCEPGTRFYAGAPLIDRDGFNLGTLCLLDTVPHDPLTAEEEATLVDLAAMVVDELELRLAAQQIASVDAALVEITQGVARVTGGEFFDELVRHFAKVLGTDYVYIGLVEGTEPKMMRTIATCVGGASPLENRGKIVKNLEYRLQDTPCWEAIEQRKICSYPRNVQAHFPNAPLLKPLAVESYIAIPFYGADDNVLGLLGVMDGKPLEHVQLAESLLTIFASRIATELDRQQSELMLSEQTRLLEAVATGQPLDRCLSAMCSSIAKLSPHTRACVLLTDDLRTKFPRSITPDFPPSLGQGLKDAPINELAIGTCGTAVYCGEPVTCADIASDDRWSQQWRDLCIAHGIRACHSLPIIGIDNLPLGSVMLCFSEARLPTDWKYRLGEFGTKIASITIDRKRSIEKLSESEERLSLALTAADMATWDADLSTGKTIWSANHFQILGYEPTTDGPATIEMWMSRIHPDDRSAVMQARETAQRARSLYRMEYRLVRADSGRVVWVAATGQFLDNYAGSAMRFVGVMFDITDRKQTEAASQLDRERLAFVLDTTGVGLWMNSLPLGVLNWDDRTRALFFTPPDVEPTIDLFWSRVHPDDREPTRLGIEAALRDGTLYEIDHRAVNPDTGEIRWIRSAGKATYAPDGEPISFDGINYDISLRKHAETALRQSEERFHTLADNMSQFAWMTDENGWIFWYNRRWFEYTGTTLAQMQGWGWQSVHHPEHVDRVVGLFRHHIDIGEYWEDTFPLRGRNGTYRWFLSRAVPIRDESGRITRWFGTNTDITELQQAEAVLAERNQELNSFVHTVSHDLKAPLRAISNLSVWIEDDLEDQLPPDNQQQLQLLRTRVKRMESMIDSLLLYAKFGRQEAKLETFNFAELLAEIIDSLAPPQSFRIEIEPPLPTLTTKRVFLSQVFANLISNAIKHHTSVTGHLHIWAIEHPDCHEFIIRDDGPGIAPEHHEKIFGIFQTLKGADNSDSTGIGLAIVKKIIETEQGTIRLESSLGQGTTFYVTWPKIHG